MQTYPGLTVRNAATRLAIPWHWVAAALAAIGMLLTFGLVVSDGARRGDLRRIAVATHSDAIWRCNTERSKRARDDCLLLLNPAPRGHNVEWIKK